MQHSNKINAINAIIFAVVLVSMSGEYLAAQHYRCDETKFLNDLKPLLLSEMGLKLTSTDSMKMRKAIEENVNHRSVVVQPNADSHIWEIDSIMSSVDYDAILSDLYESVLDEYKNTAACFKECVVPNYSYFEVERLKGSLWLDFDAPYIKPHFRIGCKFDYAIRITASDLPRRMDYTISDPTQWSYVWENDGKMYLFRNLITKEFHATNNSIKLPYDPDNKETKYNIGQTFWTFPIKDGKIIGAYVSFHFADIDVRPTIDLFNNTYIYPHVYLKKDYNKYLKYLHVNDIMDSGTKEKTPSDHGHCVSGQDCQALAEQRVPEGKIFVSVEQMPQFPGGEAELLKYVSDHLVYPEEAKKNGIKGRVVIQFVVLADGAIGEVKVARGKSAELDKAAVEVVKNLPKFKPGLLNDQPVAVWYTLPVIFKLPQE